MDYQHLGGTLQRPSLVMGDTPEQVAERVSAVFRPEVLLSMKPGDLLSVEKLADGSYSLVSRSRDTSY